MSTSAPESTQIQLKITDVHADVAGQPVLQGLSLEIKQGEFVAILGHNGAGKSTLLRMLLGLTPAKSGRIELARKDITKTSTPDIVASGVALVPQQRGYFDNLTVEDNLAFGERGDGTISRDQVRDMFPALKDRMGQVVGTMSGGQRQMVAISIALMSSPRLLMLDEPSVGLQPNLVNAVMRVAQQINQDFGITVVMVEQNIEKVLQVVQRVVVINRGKVMLDQPVEKVSADDVWRLL